MNAASKRLASLLASLGILVASIFVYTLLLAPAYREVNVLRGDLASREDVLADQKEISKRVQDLITKNQSLSTLKDSVSRAIPGKEDYPGSVSQLTGLANAAQLRIESIGMNALPSGGGKTGFTPNDFPAPGILQITVGATGSYQGLKDFLLSIERNIRITDLVSVGMSPSSGASQNLSYIIILNSYYQSL